jgi:hypothetical protein
MNTTLNTRAALISRITRRAAALAASTLVTFTGLQLITNYAMPRQPAAETVTMAAAGTTSATPAR